MKLKTEPQVLKCLLAVNLNVNIWSARRKLNPEDFKHGELPPEGLASLGSKKIANPQDLRIFGTLKARAVSILDKVGVRFLGGWAIPEDKAVELTKGLQAIADEFYDAKSTFMQNYDQAVQSWITSNPGWENIIAGSVVSAGYVQKHIAFNWQTYKVVNPGKQTSLQVGLNTEVEQLGSTLFDEVAKVAREAWDKTYRGKNELTLRALSPLKNIHAKLEGLSFVEPRVWPVAELILSAISKVPKRGGIRGTELLMLKQLVTILSEPSELIKYAQEIIDGRSKENVLDCLIKAESPPKKKTAKAKKSKVTEPQTALQLDSCGLW